MLAVVGCVLLSALVVLPLIGWPPLIRVAPVLLAAALALTIGARPWRWTDDDWDRVAAWRPSDRVLRRAAAVAGLILFWFVWTRFRSGQINAIDFTVYYDRPCFQTLLGHPLYVESADDTARAFRSVLAVHAHWLLLPLAALYAIWATPLWLLALSVVAVVAGAVYTFRIVDEAGGGGLIGSAAALAFVLNDNTARTLNYGFHAEVFYAWFVPWMIHAGLQRRWRSFAAAAACCIALKEDAFLLLVGVAAVLALAGRRPLKGREWLYAVAPVAIALVNLALFYRLVVPRLSANGAVFYANYWANYGPTAATAALGMLRRPGQVIWSTLTSAFTTRVLVPHLYLPLVGWRWFIGIVPVVLLYGASANEQIRSFGIYYAIVLVPFMVLGSASGAERCARFLIGHAGRARAAAAAALVAGALLGGVTNAGYSLRPWKPEITALPALLDSLGPNQIVLIQSGLYPHAGYAANRQLLTEISLNDPRYAGAVLVLTRRVTAYPLTPADTEPLYALPAIARTSSGLVAVQWKGAPAR